MPQIGMYEYVSDIRIPVLHLSDQLRDSRETRLSLLRLRLELPSCSLCRDTGKHKGKTCVCSR